MKRAVTDTINVSFFFFLKENYHRLDLVADMTPIEKYHQLRSDIVSHKHQHRGGKINISLWQWSKHAVMIHQKTWRHSWPWREMWKCPCCTKHSWRQKASLVAVRWETLEKYRGKKHRQDRVRAKREHHENMSGGWRKNHTSLLFLLHWVL